MKLRPLLGTLVLAGFLLLPSVPVRPDAPAPPRGGIHWVCLAYGGLAGAALAGGNVVGALGLTLGAYNHGCFR